MTKMSPTATWIVNDNNGGGSSTTTIQVKIPPGSSIQCLSQSIICYDNALLRLRQPNTTELSRGNGKSIGNNNNSSSSFLFMGRNSTAKHHEKNMMMEYFICIENISGMVGKVLLSPSSSASSDDQIFPSRIAMHALDAENYITTGATGLWISMNSFFACDSSMQIIEAEDELSNTDPTHMILVRISDSSKQGGGYIALLGHGDVHKDILMHSSDFKAVRKDHLIAYSDSIICTSSNSNPNNRMGSEIRNQPLLDYYHLQGPGVIYVQTCSSERHKTTTRTTQSSFSSSERGSENGHNHNRYRHAHNNASRTLFKVAKFVGFCYGSLFLYNFVNLYQNVLVQRAAEYNMEYDHRHRARKNQKAAIGSGYHQPLPPAPGVNNGYHPPLSPPPGDGNHPPLNPPPGDGNDSKNNHKNQDPWQEEEL